MKITIDVECTPEEARAFLGLPDLRPMQEALMGQIQERLTSGLQTMDGEALLRTWIPSGLNALEPFTKALFSHLELALGREPRK